MFRTKPTRSERLKMQVVEAREHAAATASELGHTAGERLAVMREQAAPVATDAAERVKLALDEAKLRAAPVAADLAERARPKVESAQSTLVDSLLPKVGAAIGVASAALAQGADEAKERMRDEPRVKHARESARDHSDRVRDAYRVLSGEAVAKPVRHGRRTWLIVIGLGAAAVAAVAAYRRQQADDPWATSSDGSLGGTGASTAFDASPSLKDKAAEKVGTAKEAVTEAVTGAAAKAKDKATDLAAKGQAALSDAKDRSSDDLVTDAEVEQASTWADEQLDEPGATPWGNEGEVTAVDSTLGSDAIDGSVGTLPSETRGSTPKPKA